MLSESTLRRPSGSSTHNPAAGATRSVCATSRCELKPEEVSAAAPGGKEPSGTCLLDLRSGESYLPEPIRSVTLSGCSSSGATAKRNLPTISSPHCPTPSPGESSWRTERVYEDLKGELGLDHFEGRRFPGWHHHVSVALCCYAFIVAERVQRFPPSTPAPLENRAKPIPAGASLLRQLHYRSPLHRSHHRIVATPLPGLPQTTQPMTQ